MKKHGQARFDHKFSKLHLLGFLALSLSLPVIYGAACLYASETVIVNKAFNKKEIKVRAGGSIRVELEEPGATGYTWKLQKLDADYFETPKEETKGTPPQDSFTGAPVLRTWLIRTKKAGQSDLKFIYYRPWEDEKTASDTFLLRVRIVP
jgi:predicted secreted protein